MRHALGFEGLVCGNERPFILMSSIKFGYWFVDITK